MFNEELTLFVIDCMFVSPSPKFTYIEALMWWFLESNYIRRLEPPGCDSILIRKIRGNFLAVQWLGLSTFTAAAWIQPLVRELRSCKPAKNKKRDENYPSLSQQHEDIRRRHLSANQEECSHQTPHLLAPWIIVHHLSHRVYGILL